MAAVGMAPALRAKPSASATPAAAYPFVLRPDQRPGSGLTGSF
jgi:hypothetical protein